MRGRMDIEDLGPQPLLEGVNPQEASVCVQTFGCVHNVSDGEYMKGLLRARGFTILDDPLAADVVVVNGCTVKNPSESSAMNLLNKYARLGKRVVSAGCITQADPGHAELPASAAVIGVRDLDSIAAAVASTALGADGAAPTPLRLVVPPPARPSKKERRRLRQIERRAAQERRERCETSPEPPVAVPSANEAPKAAEAEEAKALPALPSLFLPKARRNPLIETLPVAVGCTCRCTYCRTREARGDLQSYAPEDLIRRATEACAEGAREIWLTGEDVAAYGLDLPRTRPEIEETWNFARLVKALSAAIPQDCMIRCGHTNPNHVWRQLDELGEVWNLPNVFAFAHLPIQAASNRVLQHMRRPYTVEQYRHIVATLRARVPDLTIATDIICGYSNEEEEDFQQSLDLIRDLQFPIMNLTQMYPRPGTPAFKMPRVPSQTVKQRSRRATKEFQAVVPFDYLVGRTGQPALFTELSACKRYLVGHIKNYVQVLLPRAGHLAEPPAGEPGESEPKATTCDREDEATPLGEQDLNDPDLGRWIRVDITLATRFYVFAERSRDQ
eukprot:gnl/Trimastix_PCT/1783.p1 GENE.gnl/Trimastix_PCT/1783~~gnl/Trimastix_PCT/1783.p1  ORF type:complete len:558 (+),score=161.95 gnl/Trimastix_PCT/1783:26-1699(+)